MQRTSPGGPISCSHLRYVQRTSEGDSLEVGSKLRTADQGDLDGLKDRFAVVCDHSDVCEYLTICELRGAHRLQAPSSWCSLPGLWVVNIAARSGLGGPRTVAAVENCRNCEKGEA